MVHHPSGMWGGGKAAYGFGADWIKTFVSGSQGELKYTNGPSSVWDGGKAAYGFGADWIRTLVSTATESPC